jgi:hypothetical protein
MMRKRRTLWQYGAVMIGAYVGYALALQTEPISQYSGLLYRLLWTLAGATVGVFVSLIVGRRNSN